MDGITEDDIPMMQVGPPTPTDPNQVTTKPRQMPSDGGAPGMADPAAGPNDDGEQAAADPFAQGNQAPGPDAIDDASGDATDQAGKQGQPQTPDDTAGDATSASSGDDGDDDSAPPPSFTAAVLPRLAAIALDAWDANPRLSPKQAMRIAQDTLATQVRLDKTAAYQYDPTMWMHQVGPTGTSRIPDWISRGLDWYSRRIMAVDPHGDNHPAPPKRPQPIQGATPAQKRAQEAEFAYQQAAHAHEVANRTNPMRPTRMEEALKLRVHRARVDALHAQVGRQGPAAPGGPQNPQGHGGPSTPPPPAPQAPQGPQAPGGQHSSPTQAPGQQNPATWGEWARRQIDQFGQEAAKNLWHLRHSAEPYRPDQRPATHEDVGEDWHKQWGEEPPAPKHRAEPQIPNLDDW